MLSPYREKRSPPSSRGCANFVNSALMDCLLSRLPLCVRAAVEPYRSSVSSQPAQLAGVALASLLAVYVGYLYILSRREAAVTFNVPLPREVRQSGDGKKWDDVQGQEKRILEDQARGVSLRVRVVWQPGSVIAIECLLIARFFTEMERQVDHELLPG